MHTQGNKQINIFINDEHIRAPKEQMTGAEIKALGRIPEGNRLFKEVPGPGQDTPIPDDLLLNLKSGDRFYDLPVGTKGEGDLPPIEQQIDRVRQEYPALTATAQPDGSLHLEIPAVAVAHGWSKSETSLLVIVPAAYPAEKPQGFFCDPDLQPSTKQTAGGFSNQLRNGRNWGYFCWHPTKWDPSRDTLWKYVKFSLSRFEDLT